MTASGLQLFVQNNLRNIPKRLALGLFSALIIVLSYRLALLISNDPSASYWAAGGVAAAFGLTASLKLFQKSLAQQVTDTVALAIANDTSARFIASSAGVVLHKNPAANDACLFGKTVAQIMDAQILDSEDLISRLQEAAGFDGHISERITTRLGTFYLEVSQLEQGLFLWSIKPRSASDPQAETGPVMPMLTAASSGTILFMNAAARAFLGERKTKLTDVFEKDLLNASDMNIVRTNTGLSRCFIMEKPLSGGRREIYIVPARDDEIPNTGLSFEDLPVPILKTNVNGDILVVNDLARNLLGETLSQANHLSDVMEGLGRPLRDWLTEAAAGRAQSLTEFLRLKRDDREAYMQVTLGRLPGEEQDTTLFAVINDATELKTLEAQFVQSQKMQAIGQLAGGVAHDFNNLLTAISGHCDLLLLRHDEEDPDFADLTQINQNANRAAALVGQLLAYSRKQTLRPITLDLRDSLSNVSHLLNRLVGANMRLKVEHAVDLQCINVDRQQFEQVVMNLVVNARDAMPNGGDIEITSENVHFKTPLNRDNAVVPPGDYVSVRVTDHGTGISSDKKSKVFEPFYTTKQTGEGTGLGLSTAYGIVKQSGGFIFLDSVVGQGTTFTLYFPASGETAETAPTVQKTDQATANQEGVVLLVEDEAPVRAFASRALRLKGLTVLEADSAENALTLLEDTELNIDLFVSDVVMPGMDGPTWVKQAREIRPDTRVIFMSGYAEESFAETSGTLDNSTFLPKPFSLAELSNAVEQQITQSRDALV